MPVSDAVEFRALLEENLGKEIRSDQIGRIVAFREDVLVENAVQNLTRLTTPRDFYEGHVLDVLHLERSGLLTFPALDLGAGMGVPGVLHAIVFRPEGLITWISCDSEAKKTDFSRRTIEKFALAGVSASPIRGEKFLSTQTVSSIVARAVGPVTRIYGWLRNCSTWNNLILLKGPKWEEEWSEFEKSAHRGRLVIDRIYEYRVGAEEKDRKIVRLRRK